MAACITAGDLPSLNKEARMQNLQRIKEIEDLRKRVSELEQALQALERRVRKLEVEQGGARQP
jgi:polyhydroxyalkanoate synthesis regulator phasin